MMNRWFFLLVAMIGVGVIFQTQQAEAAVAGQPCDTPGMTQLSDDQHNVHVCLYSASHTLVWTALASTTQNEASPLGQTVSASIPATQAQARAVNAHSRWQGWYAGGTVGYAGATNRYDDVATDTGVGGAPEELNIDGGTAGVVGGFNQVTNNGLFYGGEADINYMSNIQHLQYIDGVTGNLADAKSRWEGYATMRGRLGFAFDPGLIFLTGGLALADVRDTYSFPTAYPIVTGFSQQGIKVGWTAGAGAEFALTDNISISLEYLRLQIPTMTNVEASDDGAPLKFHLDNSANILRVGANWHFD